MKRVTMELVTVVEVVTAAADNAGAELIAEGATRERFPGRGYALRVISVEDVEDQAPTMSWRRP